MKKKDKKKQNIKNVEVTLIQMIKRKNFYQLPENVFFYFLKGKNSYEWILQKNFDPKKSQSYTTASKKGIVFVDKNKKTFYTLK